MYVCMYDSRGEEVAEWMRGLMKGVGGDEREGCTGGRDVWEGGGGRGGQVTLKETVVYTLIHYRLVCFKPTYHQSLLVA